MRVHRSEVDGSLLPRIEIRTKTNYGELRSCSIDPSPAEVLWLCRSLMEMSELLDEGDGGEAQS